MSGNEINRRIRKLCEARSWTVYRLAKESGITYSTLSTMLNQDNLPTFPTLEKICGGFGITLCQFFGDDAEFFTAEEKVHLHRWGVLIAGGTERDRTVYGLPFVTKKNAMQ